MTTVEMHDFSGHHFPAQLCRHLAATGHEVEHVSSGEWVSGKGHLERSTDDHEHLRFDTIALNLPFQKYAPWARVRWELAYGRAWVNRVRDNPAAVVIACNLPLISLWVFARYARKAGQPWILWHQDIYSFALADELHRRFPTMIARLGGRMLRRMEAGIARSATHVVAIGDAFTEVYRSWKIGHQRTSVVRNWAPLDTIYPTPRDNPHATLLFGDDTDFRLVYAGTLGRKHNPTLLCQLAEQTSQSVANLRLAVVSEGEGADEISRADCAQTGHVRVFPFQSADDLPEVLGSADVLVVLLEPSAAMFSIPSKVLTYMAAGRPILGLMPRDNPAAADICAAGGFVVEPNAAGVEQAVGWLTELAADPARRTEIGIRTRLLAEQQFDVDDVAATFGRIIANAIHKPTRRKLAFSAPAARPQPPE